jgi:uncharacterized protein
VAEAHQPYKDLRDMALHATDVSTVAGPVAGVVVDIPRRGGSASIASFGDGTTSLYTGAGGGVIGAGRYRPVAEASRHLLSTVASQAASFAAKDSGEWPPAGSVRFHLVSSEGNRYLDVPEACFWGREKHDLMPLIEAAQRVITGIRLVQDAQSASLPGDATHLMAAAHQGDARSVQKLLDYGARLEAHDDAGYTAIMYAANAGRDDVVRVLLERGADPNAKDRQSSTPLMFAAQGGHTQMIRRLLDSGADPSVRATHGLTALGFAQQNGHGEAARILAEAGNLDTPP